MEIKIDDYIVITISREKDAESMFLKKAGRANYKDWCYAAMGSKCANKTISWPTSEKTEYVCYSFYLINAYCWKCHVNHHAKCSCNNSSNPSEKIKNLLENINKDSKKIIVWTHTTDNIPSKEIKKLFAGKLSFCGSFSHASPNHIVEHFMLDVCANSDDNFQKAFKNLIESSLKKKANPHLIALSILCQGYLAAHGEGLDGWNKVPQDIKDKAAEKLNDLDYKKNPSKKEWWKSVISDRKEIEAELKEIEAELDENGKTALESLLDAVYGKESLSVEIVNGAYIALKSIPKG